MLRILRTTAPVKPVYRRIGLLALSLAVLSVLMPTIGVLDILPVAISLGAVSLYGGFRGIGAGVLVMCAMDLIISPAFWANIELVSKPFSVLDHTLAYFDLVGIIAMSTLLFTGIRD